MNLVVAETTSAPVAFEGDVPWLRLRHDGDYAAVVFLGEPLVREMCFADGVYVPLDAKLRALGCAPSLRVALLVALYPDGDVLVFEQGTTWFRELLRVRETYPLSDWAFTIRRHGASRDPRTTYSIEPLQRLTPVEKQRLAALPPLDLAALLDADVALHAVHGGSR